MPDELFSTRSLAARGWGTDEVATQVAAGRIIRVRRGWYATPRTPPEVATAARIGGRLTCLAALRLHGAWTLESSAIHVRLSSGVRFRRVAGVRLHWTPLRVGPGVDEIEEALECALGCTDLRALVVVVDSLANRRLLSLSRLRDLLAASPKGRRVLELMDPAAESGIETLIRLALRSRRIRLRSQVVIPGVGRVDLLIGDRLVIEADGFTWHGDRDAFERDRDRDRELVRRGYIVLRPSYRRVIDDLDAIVIAVVDIIRRREHRWRAVHGVQRSGSGRFIDL